MLGKKTKVFNPPAMPPKPAAEVLVTGENYRVIRSWTEEMVYTPHKIKKSNGSSFPEHELTPDGKCMYAASWQPVIIIEQKNKNAMEEPYYSPVLTEAPSKMTPPQEYRMPIYRQQTNDPILTQHSNE